MILYDALGGKNTFSQITELYTALHILEIRVSNKTWNTGCFKVNDTTFWTYSPCIHHVSFLKSYSQWYLPMNYLVTSRFYPELEALILSKRGGSKEAVPSPIMITSGCVIRRRYY